MRKCPGCGAEIDAQTPANGPEVQPTPGDVSVCFYCGAVGIFTEGGGVRLPDPAEAAELDRAPEVLHVRAALVEFWGRQ